MSLCTNKKKLEFYRSFIGHIFYLLLHLPQVTAPRSSLSLACHHSTALFLCTGLLLSLQLVSTQAWYFPLPYSLQSRVLLLIVWSLYLLPVLPQLHSAIATAPPHPPHVIAALHSFFVQGCRSNSRLPLCDHSILFFVASF